VTTLADQVHDIAVKHRIALGRHSTAVVRKVVAQLNRIEKSVVERLQRADNETIAGRRLQQLLAEVRGIQAAGWDIIKPGFTADVEKLAEAEIAFNAKLVHLGDPAITETFTGAPALTQVVAAVKARPFQGRVLKGWLADTEASTAARVRDVIRQGFVEGQTTQQIVRTLRGTAAAQFKDGVLQVSRRGVEAVVRTALTHTANVAAQETYKALGVAQWRFVATLDARTTLLCASLHGKVFDVGTGPQPPRHFNCRSTSIAVTEPIPGVAPMPFPSYEEWLRRQPASVQDDILGPGRAALFRQGGLKIDSFVDSAGKTLTLEQLKGKNEEAFKAVSAASKVAAPAPTLTSAELGAIEDYTGDGYKAVNAALRSGERPSNAVANAIGLLDSALAKSALQDTVTVYRGVDAETATLIAGDGLRRGDIIRDAAFVSASRDLDEAKGFQGPNGLLMAITATAGQRAFDVAELSSVGTAEREILFARGSRLKVVRWDDEARTLYVERLPD
jgi:SPP1 gp7 family putative phage head morphogenesis protein